MNKKTEKGIFNTPKCIGEVKKHDHSFMDRYKPKKILLGNLDRHKKMILKVWWENEIKKYKSGTQEHYMKQAEVSFSKTRSDKRLKKNISIKVKNIMVTMTLLEGKMV